MATVINAKPCCGNQKSMKERPAAARRASLKLGLIFSCEAKSSFAINNVAMLLHAEISRIHIFRKIMYSMKPGHRVMKPMSRLE